jgi:ankyrin repeat protein
MNKNDIFETDDQTLPQNIFLSKIKLKSPFEEIKTYYNENKQNIDLTKRDIDKNLPLQISVYSKDYNSTKLIIENFKNKDDINLQNSLGWSALHTSCALKDTNEITQLLLLNDSDINLLNKNNQTPLHIACGKNRVENIQILLSSTKINLNIIDYNGFTPLIKAAASQSYEAINALLMDKDVKLNIKDKIGNTALHYVCEDNKYDVAVKLIQCGADINIENNDKKNPLDLIRDSNVRDTILSYIKTH